MKTDERFTADIDAGSASLLAVPIGYTEPLNTCVSLTGDLKDQNIHTGGTATNGTFSTSTCVGISKSDVSPEAETTFTEDDSGEMGHNGVCFRGAQKRYHSASGEWKTLTVNTGHWGPNVYDGCGMVRMGMYAHLKVI